MGSLSWQLVQQGLRIFEVRRVKPFGEPVIDWGKEVAGFGLTQGADRNLRISPLPDLADIDHRAGKILEAIDELEAPRCAEPLGTLL